MNYGHWKSLIKFNPDNSLSFVYVMTLSNNKKYVGAKKMWVKIKKPPSSFKRPPKCGFKSSDWRRYRSSSSSVLGALEEGAEAKEMLIVGVYDSWGKALYSEACFQIYNNVMSSDKWLNSQIEGRFNAGCDDDKIMDDVHRYILYADSPKSSDVYQTKTFMRVFNTRTQKNEELKEPSDRVLSLLKGDERVIDGYTLQKEHIRRWFSFSSAKGEVYYNVKDVNIQGMSKNNVEEFGFVYINKTTESKKDFKKRISRHDVIFDKIV